MVVPVQNGKTQFFDGAGVSLALGTVAFYVPATTTPKDTWQDSNGTSLNTNPVQLDANGCAIIFGSGSYRQIVKDALGNTIWDQVADAIDPVAVTASLSASLAATTGASLIGADAIDALASSAVAGQRLRTTLDLTNFAVYSGITRDDIATLNACIAHLNAHGATLATDNIGFVIDIPDFAAWDFRAGGITPLLVSNVTFRGTHSTVLLVRDGPLFTLGATGTMIENFAVRGCQFVCPEADTPSDDQACIWAVNAARIIIDNPKTYRVRRLAGCDIAAGDTVANTHIRNPIGHGLPDSSYVDYKNLNGGTGADVQVINPQVFAYLPPANPPILAPVISAITQANPGKVTTSTPHGMSTGNKVLLRDCEGMTQVNGNSYVVTAIDANSFTIGVDTTGFGAHTAGTGFAPALHWSWPYTGSLVNIEGSWDTVLVRGGLSQHYRYCVKLRSTGVISFVCLDGHLWDYGGSAKLRVELDGGSMSHLWLGGIGSENFCLDGPLIETVRTSGAGGVNGVIIDGEKVTLTGLSIIDDPSGILQMIELRDMPVYATNRIGNGTKYGIRLAASTAPVNSDIVVENVTFYDPSRFYGAGGSQSLLPSVGFFNASGETAVSISGCLLRALTDAYSVTIGSGIQELSDNRGVVAGVEVIPEYVGTSTPSVGASPWTWTNNTGAPALAYVSGGAVSAIAVTVSGGSALTVATATGANVLVGRGQSLVVTYSSAPTVRIVGVNT